MDLSALDDFNLVAGQGGFGRASRASGRPKATLSRHVADLEASLGVRLIDRGQRSLRLTEAGALLHARTKPLLDEIADAGATLGTPDCPRGFLQVSAPSLLSDTVLGGVAASFARAHPAVKLEIRTEDRHADPIEEDIDVVIRLNPRPDERLAGRCVLRDERWLVLAPGIALPSPLVGDGPAPLPSVVQRPPEPGEVWRIRDSGVLACYAPAAVLSLSSLPMLRDAVAAGAGAGALPRCLVASDVGAGRLACRGVFDEPPTEVWALHAARRLVSPKVTAFVEYLAQALRGVAEI